MHAYGIQICVVASVNAHIDRSGIGHMYGDKEYTICQSGVELNGSCRYRKYGQTYEDLTEMLLLSQAIHVPMNERHSGPDADALVGAGTG